MGAVWDFIFEVCLESYYLLVGRILFGRRFEKNRESIPKYKRALVWVLCALSIVSVLIGLLWFLGWISIG